MVYYAHRPEKVQDQLPADIYQEPLGKVADDRLRMNFPPGGYPESTLTILKMPCRCPSGYYSAFNSGTPAAKSLSAPCGIRAPTVFEKLRKAIPEF